MVECLIRISETFEIIVIWDQKDFQFRNELDLVARLSEWLALSVTITGHRWRLEMISPLINIRIIVSIILRIEMILIIFVKMVMKSIYYTDDNDAGEDYQNY